MAVPSAEELVGQHAELVQRLTFRLCHSVEEAREAAQETFLNLLEALPGFRGECALSTWIYRITVNTCRGRGRRRQVRRTREAVPLKLAKWALSLLPVVKGEVEKHAEIDFDALRGLLNEGFAELESLAPMDIVKIKDKDTRVRIGLE
jgi:RNA polymerase sigma factor (sigma-70 family)